MAAAFGFGGGAADMILRGAVGGLARLVDLPGVPIYNGLKCPDKG